MTEGSSNGMTATGVPGLDVVLQGGLPRHRLYLVQGDPGAGKTTMALQWLLHGAAAGERCLYVTLSETREELQAVADSHGWALDALSVFELPASTDMSFDADNTLFHPSEVELAEITKVLLREVDRIQPTRVVIDSLSEIRLLAQNALRYRRHVLSLKQFFVERGSTVLFLDDRTSEQADLQLQSLAHGVICLDQLAPLYGAHRRRLRVLKLRGVAYQGGFHDFVIAKGGLQVFPRLVAAEHRRPDFSRQKLSSGVPEIDVLVGGGLDPGSSTLLMGPAGTGKSTVALQYASAAARAGKPVAMFTFDESEQTILTRAAGIGLDLAPHVKEGRIQIRQVDPAELTPGEFAHTMRQAVEVRKAQLVIIDSLNGYLHAMPEEQFLTLQLHELLMYLGQMGATTMMVVAQHGFVGSMQSPIDVSYLADAVMMFRHFEAQGRLRKAISMVKKRTGDHESVIRELTIGARGLVVGAPLENFRGVLTGIPAPAQVPREE
jgi:circadian clock protein KaiC